MRILLVEDDTVSLKLLETILIKQSHEIVTTFNGREAIESLNKAEAFDLIISDIMMPEIDGLSLLKFVKSKQRFSKIPFILTTSLNDIGTVKTAMGLGIDGYLAKPITKEILVSKLDEIQKNLPSHILVVDDEEIIRALLQRVIENEGYKVLTADSGENALEIIEKQKISLVISDIKMPGISGIELLDKIKSAHKEIIVMLMTGYSLEFDKDEAMAKGADDYISKPFNNTTILQKIRFHYSKKKNLVTS